MDGIIITAALTIISTRYLVITSSIIDKEVNKICLFIFVRGNKNTWSESGDGLAIRMRAG